MNKRGSMWDSFLVIGLLLVFAIGAFVSFMMIDKFNDAIQGADVSQIAKDNSQDLDTAWPGVMDWLFAAFVFGLPLVSMGLAYTNFVPDTFFYLILGVMLLMVFVGFAMQDLWTEFATGSNAVGYVSQMPIINHVMGGIGWYGLLFILIIGYGTYVKLSNSQGGGFV